MSEQNELNKELLERIRGGGHMDEGLLEVDNMSTCPECGMVFDVTTVEYKAIETNYFETGTFNDLLFKCPSCNNFVHFEPRI